MEVESEPGGRRLPEIGVTLALKAGANVAEASEVVGELMELYQGLGTTFTLVANRDHIYREMPSSRIEELWSDALRLKTAFPADDCHAVARSAVVRRAKELMSVSVITCSIEDHIEALRRAGMMPPAG